MGKISPVHENFGLRTNFRKELSSFNEVWLYIYIYILQHDAVATDGMDSRKVSGVLPPECSSHEATWDK